MGVVDVDDILKIFRVVPKIVEVFSSLTVKLSIDDFDFDQNLACFGR
jgi:hypothetical protein